MQSLRPRSLSVQEKIRPRFRQHYMAELDRIEAGGGTARAKVRESRRCCEHWIRFSSLFDPSDRARQSQYYLRLRKAIDRLELSDAEKGCLFLDFLRVAIRARDEWEAMPKERPHVQAARCRAIARSLRGARERFAGPHWSVAFGGADAHQVALLQLDDYANRIERIAADAARLFKRSYERFPGTAGYQRGQKARRLYMARSLSAFALEKFHRPLDEVVAEITTILECGVNDDPMTPEHVRKARKKVQTK